MKVARDLRPIPLDEVLPLGQRRQLVMTMGEDQWDGLLAAAYEAGFVLLELDAAERPVRAYRKAETSDS